MATLFTKIIEGSLPARFIWKDDLCVSFLTIAPIRPGHALVVPRQEVDHWLDADDPLLAHLMAVARRVGAAQQSVFAPARVGMMIAGLEVPHLHIHVLPIESVRDMDFANADPNPAAEDLDDAAGRLRDVLGYADD